MRITFEKVEIKATKHWVDARGKKRQKTGYFMQTLSPWNVNADGSLKNREQILTQLRAERDAWLSRSM